MIQTPRLILRPLEETDYQIWKSSIQNLLPKQNDYDRSYCLDMPCTKQEFQRLLSSNLESWHKDFSYNLYAFSKLNGKLIGDSQLWGVVRFECQRATLGYSVLNNHWRSGYGLEIARATIEFGFQTLKLNLIEAEILPENFPSIELCKKAGMKSEGIRRQALKVDSDFKDHQVLSIIASDVIQSSFQV